ncbi:MAG: biotin--[acetyl-CoA-carboxylase] ligase [Candidatus Cryptobacteroides sp.]
MRAEMDITWFDTIDSTNNEAKRRLSEIDKMAVYAARYQTAGRGQRGNTWSSEAGENLTFSIALRLGKDGAGILQAKDQFSISVISALSIQRYLKTLGVSSMIKWPNDIYVRDRKICGMLIENGLEGDRISSSVIGIGLNLRQRNFPPALVNPTSVVLSGGEAPVPEKAIEDFMEIFNGLMPMLFTEESRKKATEEYLGVLYRKEARHEYRDLLTGETFMGTIKGISTGGRLLVEMPDSHIKDFSFKEIGYII